MADWLAEIGEKLPNEVTFYTAYKRVIVEAYNASKPLQREVRVWAGNTKRRSASGVFPYPGSPHPWFVNWPGWFECVGPRPDQEPLLEDLINKWYQARPERARSRRSARRYRGQELTPSQRFDILQRDGFRCRYCGRGAPDVVLHVDHVHPKVHGGTNDPANLASSCEDCNMGKGHRVLAGN